MDYCSTCRRTLNGVFVCPGCGAYAPDIAPAGSHRHHAPTTAAVMSAAVMPEISHTREFDAFPGFPEPEPEADVPVGPATPSATGRAARRRRLADWRKQRRRAVVASTVALVGGGLTLAFMPSSRPSVSHAQASSVPDPSTAPTAPSAGGADSADSADGGASGTDAERPRTGDPRQTGSGTRPSGAADSPAPAKRTTSPQTQTGAAGPAEETRPQSPTAPAAPETPPTAEQPTPQPDKPTSPAQPPPPPPPSAEPPQDDSSELCVLVLCVGLDAGR